MTHYHIDERDITFNLKECPGLSVLKEHHPTEECDEETLDMIFDQSAGFAVKVLSPFFEPGDRQGCRFVDGKVIVPQEMKEIWPVYRELGVMGMTAGAEFGGTELPHLFQIPVSELECGSCVSFSMLPLLTREAANVIDRFAAQEVRERFLERMYSGQWTGTMCLTEPGAGSDVGATATKAEPHGSLYRITGTKIFITWGDHDLTENIIHLILARIQGAPAGTKGLSLFVVPKFRVDDSGNIAGFNDVVCSNIEHKMGINASPTCALNFGDHGDCEGYLVGEPNRGLSYMFHMMNSARFEVGLQGLAQASAAYLSAWHYAQERKQGTQKTTEGFAQVPITQHPDIRRMLLNMRAVVHGCRSLLYHMALYQDLAGCHPDGRRYQALVELFTPICKSYGSDQGFRVTEWAMQVYGGYGYCRDYPIEQYMRDIKIASIYEGTNGIQAMDLVFRKILGNQGAHLNIWIEDVNALAERVQDTPLRDLAETLTRVVQTTKATVETFAGLVQRGQIALVQFLATDFQDALGHVVVAYFLLHQGLTAHQALAGTPSDRRFYEDKLITVRHYFSRFLPLAETELNRMARADEVGLQVDFDG